MSPDQRIQRVSIKQGLNWLPKSVVLLKRGFRPLVAVGALWLIVSMLAVIPVVGQLMLAIITPLLTAGVLVAFDRVAAGQQPPAGILFHAWYRPKSRPVLILLGLWTIIGAMVALSIMASWLGNQVSEAELQAALAAPENLGAMIERLEPGLGLYLAAATMILVLMGLYFAIPLSIFGEISLWPSVRASLKAIVKNMMAFLGYLITLLIVVGAFLIATISLVGATSQLPGVGGALISQMLILILSMLLQVLLVGAQYVAFCEVFGWTAHQPKRSNQDDAPSSSNDELTL